MEATTVNIFICGSNGSKIDINDKKEGKNQSFLTDLPTQNKDGLLATQFQRSSSGKAMAPPNYISDAESDVEKGSNMVEDRRSVQDSEAFRRLMDRGFQRLWKVLGSLVLLAIGTTAMYLMALRDSDAVPKYISPSYPSTFAPCIRKTSKTTPPPSMASRVLFAVHLAPILLIWILESCRHSGSIGHYRKSPTQCPVAFMMLMPVIGVAPAAAIYYALHYYTSSRSLSSTHNAAFSSMARTTLASIMLGYLAPVFWSLARFGRMAPEWSPLWAWLTFPVLLPATHELLAATFQGLPFSSISSHAGHPGCRQEDGNHQEHPLEGMGEAGRLLSIIRTPIYGMAIFSTLAHAKLVLGTMGVWIPEFVQSFHGPQRNIFDMLGNLDATTIDHAALLAVSFVWLGLLLLDMTQRGLVRAGWIKIALLSLVGVLFAGPGTVILLGWYIRERVLSSI